MKRDNFYLVMGIIQIILALYNLFKHTYINYIFAVILLSLGILIILKDYFGIWKK